MNPYLLMFAVSTLVDLVTVAVVLAVLGHRKPSAGLTPPIGAAEVAAAGFVGCLAFAVKLPVHAVLGTHVFGFIHLVFLDVAVAVPLTGAGILVIAAVRACRRRSPWFTRPVIAAGVLGVAAAGVAAWARFVEPTRLAVERVEVPVLPPAGVDPGVRLAVLADVQTDRVAEYEYRAIDTLMSLGPDVILIPGDLFQGTDEQFERELPAMRELLGRLRAPGGVWATQGHCESLEQMRRMIEGTGVRLLLDEVTSIRVRGYTMALAGMQVDYRAPAARRALAELAWIPDADVRILLCHVPDAVFALDESDHVDLVVAGHTHGGQIQLPGLGPLVTFSRVPRATAAGGLTRVNGHAVYVSRGVGCESGEQAPRIRLFCRPEISLLTLVSRDIGRPEL